MEFLIGGLGIIVLLGFSIFIHELGHFATAKYFKVPVEEFALGMGPRICGKEYGGTMYALNWVPFGGYVKMGGMLPESEEESKESTDETEDKEGAKAIEKVAGDNPMADMEALRNQPYYAKVIIFAAGCFMNFITAIFIFSMLYWFGVTSYRSVPSDVGPIKTGNVMQSLGYSQNDVIVGLNGSPIADWDDIESELVMLNAKSGTTTNTFQVVKKLDTVQIDFNSPNLLNEPEKAKAEFNKILSEAGVPETAAVRRINGIPVKNWIEINEELGIIDRDPEKELKNLTISFARENDIFELSMIPAKDVAVFSQNENSTKSEDKKIVQSDFVKGFMADFLPPYPAFVAGVIPHNPADKAGMKDEDYIVEIEGIKINYASEAKDIIQNSKGNALNFKVKRGDEIVELSITPKLSTEKDRRANNEKIVGIIFGNDMEKHIQFPFLAAFHQGTSKSAQFAIDYPVIVVREFSKGLHHIKESLGGPVMIANLTARAAKKGPMHYFNLFAIINILLMVMNLLPIPILDGGHILFATIESIIRRPLPEKVLMPIYYTFFFLLISMAIVVTLFDIQKIFF